MMYREEDVHGNINSMDRFLLNEIRLQLIELNKKFNPIQEEKPEIIQPTISNTDSKLTCTVCQKVHLNMGSKLACQRKHKKESG